LASQDEAGLEPAVWGHLRGMGIGLDADENDRRFVARFDEVRLAQTQVKEGGVNVDAAYPALKDRFQKHYQIDFGATPPQQVVRLLQQRPKPIQEYLLAALGVSLVTAPDPEARRWLAEVLDLADTDPWRQQAQKALAGRDW